MYQIQNWLHLFCDPADHRNRIPGHWEDLHKVYRCLLLSYFQNQDPIVFTDLHEQTHSDYRAVTTSQTLSKLSTTFHGKGWKANATTTPDPRTMDGKKATMIKTQSPTRKLLTSSVRFNSATIVITNAPWDALAFVLAIGLAPLERIYRVHVPIKDHFPPILWILAK
jgi:hypothetical protein